LDVPVVIGNQYLIEIGGAYDESGNGILSIGEIPPAPANDSCINATDAGVLELGVPVQLVGTTVSATTDCLYGYSGEVWIKFTVSSCLSITLDFCNDENMVTDFSQVLYGDCSCNIVAYPNAVRGDCGNPQVTWYNLEPGTYYYPIPQPQSGGTSYTVNITGSECLPPPTPDFIVEAPFSGTGNTCGAGEDCYLLHAGSDHIYQVTVLTEGNWVFSLCNSNSEWNSYLALGSSICESDLGWNSNGCGQHAKLPIYNLAPGVYYLTVGSQRGSCGDYTLDIYREPFPCENSYNTNGDANLSGGIESYRSDNFEKFGADDFSLTENVTLDSIKFICATPTAFNFSSFADYLIMNDSNGVPGAVLYEGTGVASSRKATGLQYNQYDVYAYQIGNLNIELSAGTYFLAFRPVEARSSAPNYWLSTDEQNGSMAYYKTDDDNEWALSAINSDLAFCLFATVQPPPSCTYLLGDINGNGAANGIDVTYGVSYFKGGNVPPISCDCGVSGILFAAGDVNGNCVFNGIDITYYVGYLKGGAGLHPCANCPPVSAFNPHR
jgi:hypothetical protein